MVLGLVLFGLRDVKLLGVIMNVRPIENRIDNRRNPGLYEELKTGRLLISIG